MLGKALRAVGEGERAESFELFSRTLDIEWVRRVLQTTGKASVRKRKLPAEAVVWLVIGMALLRDRSIDEVVHHLDLSLPDRVQPASIAHSAIVQARTRLGDQPLAMLFDETAKQWATEAAAAHRWRGLAVYGVDGTTLRVADTADNEMAFGRPASGRAPGAYPQLRLVALMVLRAHLLAAVVPGAYDTNEQRLAEPLWPTLPEDSVVVVDKGFISYRVFHFIQSSGRSRHWLCRAKKNLQWRVVRSLGPNDELVEIPLDRSLRKAHPELPESLPARVVRYHYPGFRPQALLTSLLDPVTFPADEIAALYHERWELEIGFDEIKTHTLDRCETLRSRAPCGVLQELWGLAIAYNLVRLEMFRVAADLAIPPTRLSFRHSLMLIRNFLLSAWLASPGVLPKRLDSLHRDLALLLLPTRRPRSYPREVKIKLSGYKKKTVSARFPRKRSLK